MEKKLEIMKLTKCYASSNGVLRALDEVNFSVDKGEFLTVLGPSGCGKSTLIRCIAGFEKPTRGKVLLEGKEVTNSGPDRVMIFQEFNQLFPWKTVLRNVISL